MRLTLHADYGLRVLLYLAARPGEVVSTSEIGEAYGISKNHLVRVAQSLRDAGFVSLAVGRGGGLSLAKPASEIRVGRVVQALEPDLQLVECFDRETNTCAVAPFCGLRRPLQRALEAFLEALDESTIADVVASSGPKLGQPFVPLKARRAAR